MSLLNYFIAKLPTQIGIAWQCVIAWVSPQLPHTPSPKLHIHHLHTNVDATYTALPCKKRSFCLYFPRWVGSFFQFGFQPWSQEVKFEHRVMETYNCCNTSHKDSYYIKHSSHQLWCQVKHYFLVFLVGKPPRKVSRVCPMFKHSCL